MKFWAGLVIGILALPVLAFLCVYFGYVPIATAAPPFPFERRMASMALKARIARSKPMQPGVPANEDNLMAGARLYREYCAMCHGVPSQPKTPIALGMYPPPPQLFQGHGVTDDPVSDTYWKVTNGIRLTGMPAFIALSDTERWQISQMLATADKLPTAVSAYLAQAPAAK